MKIKHKTPAVILGMTATGLSVARSLGRKGITVFGFDSEKKQPGMFSRYVIPRVVPNAVEKEGQFINYLIDFSKKLSKTPILFLAADEYVACVSKNREKLKPYYEFNIPSREIVSSFLDKRRSYDIADKNGLLCPPTYIIKNADDLIGILPKIKYPSAIKPAFSHLWQKRYGGKKLIPVNNESELLETFTKIIKEYPQVMIQEIIPGGDDNIYLFYAYYNKRNEPIAFFIPRKLRQHPIHFGIGSLNISEMDNEVKNIGLSFFEKIGYTGIGALELKRNSLDQKIRFMELNMRFIMIGELAIASGVDLPYIMYRDMIGENVEKVFDFIEGIKLVNMELDLGSLWQYRKAKELTLWKYLNSFKGKKVANTYFSWDDILPSLFVCKRFIQMVLFKALKNFKMAVKSNVYIKQ